MEDLKDYKKRQKDIENELRLQGLAENTSRARSITVGTAFGGVTEIMMRKNDGGVIWCVLQPVEVVELIHQLSANIGCHISIKPRSDFSSWRGWNTDRNEEGELGHSSFYNTTGMMIRKPEESKKLKIAHEKKLEEDQNAETVATEETVNRRKSKRATRTA